MKKGYETYIHGLEQERLKIQVFERELPLCLDLVNRAIEKYKQELEFSVRSEQEQTSAESPVLEEFIPLKRNLSSEEEEHLSPKNDNKKGKIDMDWMRSVQLWNQTPDPPLKDDLTPRGKGLAIESNKIGGAFQPFHRGNHKSFAATTTTNTIIASPSKPSPVSVKPCAMPVEVVAMAAATSSTADNNSNKSKEDKDSQRKARRCWSPELHRRFCEALRQLGGAHAATPKQIRELMKVDGLTNDEVKSHLQKYRLHTRRPAGSMHSNGNNQPQVVLVGGIWVQPSEYSVAPAANRDATTAAAAAAASGIYFPVAAPPQPHQQRELSPPGSSRNENTHSDSPEATSSSSDTTTASPAL